MKHALFVVKSVPDKVLKDYAGMNYYAAKAMGFKPNLKKNEVLVNKCYTGSKREQVIRHEEEEAHLMSKGYPYFKAHKLALRAERKKEPKWMR